MSDNYSYDLGRQHGAMEQRAVDLETGYRQHEAAQHAELARTIEAARASKQSTLDAIEKKYGSGVRGRVESTVKKFASGEADELVHYATVGQYDHAVDIHTELTRSDGDMRSYVAAAKKDAVLADKSRSMASYGIANRGGGLESFPDTVEGNRAFEQYWADTEHRREAARRRSGRY